MHRSDLLKTAEDRAPYITTPQREPTVRVPVYDVPLEAGEGDDIAAYVAVDALVSYEEVYRDWLRDECRIDPDKAFYAPVRGDSMRELLHDGDWILGEAQDYIDREGIFALALNGMLLIKHIQQGPGPGEVSLVSQNSIYSPRVISEDRGDSIHIIGRYVRRVTR